MIALLPAYKLDKINSIYKEKNTMKKITRTITIYTYITGKFNLSEGKVEDMHKHEFPYKLGQRDKRRLESTIGAPVISETSEERLYSMNIEDFVHYATVETDSAEDETDE